MHPEPLQPVVCVAGPTGSGKTGLALKLARIFPCEIVNADSRQVYSDFPIITAQPTASEKQVVNHLLYGFLPTNCKMSAGEWQRLALNCCNEITARGHIPLLVGGTGFYFDALLSGIAAIPPVRPEISLALEKRANSEGIQNLYEELLRLDSAYAQKINPHDRQRILRSLEVIQATGRTFSWWHQHGATSPKARGPLLTLAVSLENLTPLLDKRIGEMLAMGAIEEAEKALMLCPDASAPGWSGIGCAELFSFLRGEISLSECRRSWLARTRAYAKRQLTWFRGRKNALWISADNPDRVVAVIRTYLAKGHI